jgi:predicted homoserine dehydrogenase-like protein
MGAGPYYVFYRPYHLCHIEAIGTVVDAVREGVTLLRPDHGLRTNVYAYAKVDLRAGQTLDGIGGYTCYGMIENVADRDDSPGLPICLAEGVVLDRDHARHERIGMADVRYEPDRLDFALYAEALGPSIPKPPVSER